MPIKCASITEEQHSWIADGTMNFSKFVRKCLAEEMEKEKDD